VLKLVIILKCLKQHFNKVCYFLNKPYRVKGILLAIQQGLLELMDKDTERVTHLQEMLRYKLGFLVE
jgi:hypothetical protein